MKTHIGVDSKTELYIRVYAHQQIRTIVLLIKIYNIEKRRKSMQTVHITAKKKKIRLFSHENFFSYVENDQRISHLHKKIMHEIDFVQAQDVR
jgi:hypothetical protein